MQGCDMAFSEEILNKAFTQDVVDLIKDSIGTKISGEIRQKLDDEMSSAIDSVQIGSIRDFISHIESTGQNKKLPWDMVFRFLEKQKNAELLKLPTELDLAFADTDDLAMGDLDNADFSGLRYNPEDDLSLGSTDDEPEQSASNDSTTSTVSDDSPAATTSKQVLERMQSIDIGDLESNGPSVDKGTPAKSDQRRTQISSHRNPTKQTTAAVTTPLEEFKNWHESHLATIKSGKVKQKLINLDLISSAEKHGITGEFHTHLIVLEATENRKKGIFSTKDKDIIGFCHKAASEVEGILQRQEKVVVQENDARQARVPKK
jgi:hypothetical protein